MSQQSPAAKEINRLHSAAVAAADDSRQALHAALVAAWSAGRLLREEREKVNRAMGAGAWLVWLEQNFSGSRRTAYNYMRLAETDSDMEGLKGLSLRQVYLRLGIATEPKSRAESVAVAALPPHVRLAHRLLAALTPCGHARDVPTEQHAAYRRDLRALYERLRSLFEEPASRRMRRATLHE